MNTRIHRSLLIVLCLLGLGLSAHLRAETLILWEHERDSSIPAWDELITRFAQKNPGQMIQRVHVDKDLLTSEFTMASLNRKAPDLVLSSNDFGSTFSTLNMLQSVDDLLDKTKFFTALVESGRSEGKQWGIPVLGGNHLLLYMNKQLAKEPPRTLKELSQTAERLTDPKKNIYGLVFDAQEPMWLYSFILAFGGQPLGDGHAALNTPPVVEALQWARSLVFQHKVVPEDCDYMCAEKLFLGAQAAMIINGDWARPLYAEQLKENLIIAPLPLNPQTGKTVAPLTSGQYLFVAKDTSGGKKELARKWIDFVTSVEAQSLLLERNQQIPAISALQNSKLIQDRPALAESLNAMLNGAPMPMSRELQPVWDAMRVPMRTMLSGKITAKEAAKRMQSAAARNIASLPQTKL